MQPPLDIQTTDGLQLHLPIAGVGGRSYAYLIDWHIRILFVLLWFIAIPLMFGEISALENFFSDLASRSKEFIAALVLPPIVVYLLYHPLLELVMHGRTPGKRMAGVRIVTTQGHTPGVGAILIRNIFRLIDSLPVAYMLGLLVALSTRNAVRIGDIAAGTLLVYEDKVEKKLLQSLAATSADSGISPQQWELIHELLSRWGELDRTKRIELAVRLLQDIGETVMPENSQSMLDRSLHQQLQRILQGGGHGAA